MYVCSNCHWGYLMTSGIGQVRCRICGYTEKIDEEKERRFMLLYGNGIVREPKEDEEGEEVSVGTTDPKGRAQT